MKIILRKVYTAGCMWKILVVSVALFSMVYSTETEIDDDRWVHIPKNTPQSMKDINQPNSDSSGECQKKDNSQCNDKSGNESNGGQKKEYEQKCKMANPLKNQGYSGKKQNKITKNCSIVLDILSNTKRIVLTQTENNTYSYIALFESPMLQVINTRDTSTPTIIVKDLCIDGPTFISLVTAYMLGLEKDGIQSEGDNPVRQVLVVENLHLYEMPYTFTKTHDVLSPWIKAKNVTIYIEHCDKCGIPIENIVSEQCTKETLANIGIQCEDDPVYASFTNPVKLEDKAKCSKRFIDEIGCKDIELIRLKCPNNYNSTLYSASFFLDIDLNNSKKIQNAIDEFQKRHNMVSIHAKYFVINIHGSNSPKSDISLIESIFKCLGPRIKAYSLCFYDMKEFVEINVPIQSQDLSFIILPKRTLIMDEFCFYNSDIGFIGNMLNSYHIPDIGIYIDGKEKNKKDIKALKLEAMNKKAASIATKEEEKRKRKQTPDEPKKSPTKRSLIE
ncbi:hypothetical protein NEFER03_1948 [Nematocida sp. LUAm3]|nr:hypothetical protein NEFER03_1948 [Nematocida sp. LUAm3]